MKRKVFIVFLGIVGSVFIVSLYELMPSVTLPELIPEVAGRLFFGWWSYLARVIPQVTVARDGVATALVCLAILVPGLHLFLRWLSAEWQRGFGNPSERIPPWPFRRTLALLGVILIMFVAGIAATGIAHQSAWLMTSNKRLVGFRFEHQAYENETPTVNNLKHTGLAVAQYAAVHNALPIGPADSQGRLLHSWQTALMSYLGAIPVGALHEDLPWDDPANSAYFRGVIPVYLNPDIGVLRNSKGYALSHYAGNVHLLGPGCPRLVAELGQGAANSIVAGEVASGFKPWGDPTNLRDPGRGINSDSSGFGNPFTSGAYLLFVDGSVRYFGKTTSPEVLRKLSRSVPGSPRRASTTRDVSRNPKIE